MEVRPGYKQTEVGVIPEDWETKTLESSCVPDGLVRGPFGGALKKEMFVTSGKKVYEQKNAISRDATIGSYFIDNEKFRELQRFAVIPGEFVVSCAGTIGRIFRIPPDAQPGVINQALLKIRTDGDVVDSVFFYHYFDWEVFQRRIIDNTHGGAMQNLVGMDLFRSVELACPPLPEQRAIANALSDMDALLDGLTRLIAKKRDLKRATMQQLLTGQTRLPGFSGEWEMSRLGKIARIQRGASPRPIESPIWFSENSSIGWVRISDVTRSGMFLTETMQRLSPLGVQHSRPVKSGSLIMSICATVGRPIITNIDVCIHDGFVVFDELQADQSYLYYVLKSLEPEWSKHGQTGSQMNLNTPLINDTAVHLPPVAEQTAIAAVLSDMDAELAALAARLAKTRALKQAMMQELLTGRTRLPIDKGE